MTSIFPYRQLLARELLNKTDRDIQDLAGSPTDQKVKENETIWIYKEARPPSTNKYDPKSAEVQLWFRNGRLEHAYLNLLFNDGLNYSEVIH
jgi:hypothetical protein